MGQDTVMTDTVMTLSRKIAASRASRLAIVAALERAIGPRDLAGRRVVVSAGPTVEDLDPAAMAELQAVWGQYKDGETRQVADMASHLDAPDVRAIVANAGNANACTTDNSFCTSTPAPRFNGVAPHAPCARARV